MMCATERDQVLFGVEATLGTEHNVMDLKHVARPAHPAAVTVT
jgi:hypothetical protein